MGFKDVLKKSKQKKEAYVKRMKDTVERKHAEKLKTKSLKAKKLKELADVEEQEFSAVKRLEKVKEGRRKIRKASTKRFKESVGTMGSMFGESKPKSKRKSKMSYDDSSFSLGYGNQEKTSFKPTVDWGSNFSGSKKKKKKKNKGMFDY
jgi:hypothetical protein|tara:strand:+ start:1443 stop:1889 length:447 start_codon:yes stop_codon:yes gene_type:complete